VSGPVKITIELEPADIARFQHARERIAQVQRLIVMLEDDTWALRSARYRTRRMVARGGMRS
jgi:hypothetical protein